MFHNWNIPFDLVTCALNSMLWEIDYIQPFALSVYEYLHLLRFAGSISLFSCVTFNH